MKKHIILLFILSLYCCNYLKNKKDNNIDSFYTEYNLDEISVLPLFKPIRLCFDKQYPNWFIDYSLDTIVNFELIGQRIDSIGFDSLHLYGKLSVENYNFEFINNNKYLYACTDGGIIEVDEKVYKKDLILLNPVDENKLKYIFPARWFLVDSSFNSEVFFNKKDYIKCLKKKGILEKMYNPNVYFKEYFKTGILPWFPQNIKDIKKRSEK